MVSDLHFRAFISSTGCYSVGEGKLNTGYVGCQREGFIGSGSSRANKPHTQALREYDMMLFRYVKRARHAAPGLVISGLPAQLKLTYSLQSMFPNTSVAGSGRPAHSGEAERFCANWAALATASAARQHRIDLHDHASYIERLSASIVAALGALLLLDKLDPGQRTLVEQELEFFWDVR